MIYNLEKKKKKKEKEKDYMFYTQPLDMAKIGIFFLGIYGAPHTLSSFVNRNA